jgi:benzoylformate decarboxylase
VPHPFVKWSFEPPRPQDVPAALARAIYCAALPPAGPAFVSVPMDDWNATVDDADVDRALDRVVTGRAGAAPDVVAALARRIERATNPCFVAGPDIDAAGSWEVAVALVERCRMAVFATPATGGGRLGFPESHPNFQGILPPAIAPLAAVLAPYDLVVCAGTSIFPYYPYLPGPVPADTTALVAITNDPAEAARAPVGDAIVADVEVTLRALLAEVGETNRSAPTAMAGPPPADESAPLSAARVYDILRQVLADDAIVVLESPSPTGALRNRLRISRPGSYYFAAGGGLGFGLSAAVGVQLAQPSRPVVCVLGEGSAQYAITAFWTAAAYRVPVTFLVLRNEEYGILKWFADVESVTGAPGLDLPGLEVCLQFEG